ncbi:hypothetical protein FOQG_17276 [Fusarium oxysporum f. sp. raphani 54005]|uniref:Uncharacterized protein n=2 Tax=Fusarium oxysporum TaxID=5507 RepID=X0BGQ3_FUSOX|nr:hypothetical protein FOQG_17276 [Fusarium oxysporum f. sp. raphani 54005]EXL65699.1 hypothetical protein FOPG_18077 [Fusarium oxysporum f. sp. conglutinans race 2 54008]
MTTSPGIVFKGAQQPPDRQVATNRLLQQASGCFAATFTASEPVTTTRSGVTRSSVDKEELLSCVTERHEPGPTIAQGQLEKSTQSRWQSPEALGRLHLRCTMFTMSRPPIRSSPSRSSRDRDDILFVIQNVEDKGNE